MQHQRVQGLFRGKLTDNLLDKRNWIRTGDYIKVTEDYLNVYDSNSKYWWTTTSDGKLTYYTVDTNQERQYKTEGVRPDGPTSNRFHKLYLNNGTIYAVPGSWSQEGDYNNPGEVHVWNGDTWSEFEQPTSQMIGHNYIDLLCMDFDPKKRRSCYGWCKKWTI